MSAISEESAYQLSHNWFLIDGKDQLLFGPVALGLVLQLAVFEFFFKKANETRKQNGIKGIVKKRHLEWHVRFLHNLLISRNDNQYCVDVVVLYDINNAMVIETANVVSNMCRSEKMSVAGIVVDKLIHSQATSSIDLHYLTSSYRTSDELSARRVASNLVKVFNKGYKKYCHNLTEFNLSANIISSFLRFIEKQILQLCREVIALTNLLNRLSPKTILLNSDAHRMGRIIVQLAKEQGMRTCVIQHGAPIWKYGYVPVLADKMFLWGVDAFEWFIKHGVPVSKLEIVGNPRFDDIISKSPLMSSGHGQKLFLLPNPIDRTLISSMIASFVSVARFHNGYVIMKLHPSEKNSHWFEAQIPEDLKSKIQVSTEPLSEFGICLGDIAVVANSTAGIDMILLGGRVVSVEFPDMPNPIPYSKYKVGVTTEIHNLSDAIMQVSLFSKREWSQSRKKFLKNFLYRLDGMSARRVSRIILGEIKQCQTGEKQ